MRNLVNNKITTYYLMPGSGTIKIGHDMCSGAFYFDESDQYEISFAFLDASGNDLTGKSVIIQFTKPTAYNSSAIDQ